MGVLTCGDSALTRDFTFTITPITVVASIRVEDNTCYIREYSLLSRATRKIDQLI